MECKIINMRVLGVLLVSATLFISSCYYDNYDDLQVPGVGCDTLNMNYIDDIAPIMQNHCTLCHSAASPAAGISLDTYSSVKKAADNGSLLGSMRHDQGYSMMPKNQAKLDACTISKVEAWINQGTKQ